MRYKTHEAHHCDPRAEFFGGYGPEDEMRHRHQGHGPGGRGRGRGFGRGPRARRGDVRAALLVLLNEEPRNGYALMQEIESRTDGVWRPSPGSVYPTLQQLEDEGLVVTQETNGRKEFEITDAGREVVAQRGDAPAPWEEVGADTHGSAHELGGLIRQVAVASTQVLKGGTKAQIDQARDVLTETRKQLYKILSED
ncbi:MAG TPA: PadR family transcriptional regulator [Baekduia sp.]|nr:PadR family transcriptional regulator [Baekduia sp.]